jgi:hypothetical protein
VAVKKASGHYISVLDDDDLVLANWVENFKNLSEKNYGRVLRAVTVEQDIKETTNLFDFKTVSATRHLYPNHFDLIDHLAANRTPFMSWSYPGSLFRDFNEYFDESLKVCEDWDLSMRAVFLCGVSDGPVITSIYRKWIKGNSSYSAHTQDVWRSDYEKIKNKLNSQINLMPPYFLGEITKTHSNTVHTHTDELEGYEELKKKNRELVQELSILKSSKSLKITKPFRDFMTLLRRLQLIR